WTLLGRVTTRRAALQVFGLWFGITGLASLGMAAETEAHRRQHLFCERVLLARTETGKQCRREHIGGNRLLDCSLDRPPPLAGILHVTGEFIQLRILRQRRGTKIEQ